MQISSRFTLAVHILVCIETFKDQHKVTSEFLAGSTNVNPVIVRNILRQLKRAGLTGIARGSGGGGFFNKLGIDGAACIAKDLRYQLSESLPDEATQLKNMMKLRHKSVICL